MKAILALLLLAPTISLASGPCAQDRQKYCARMKPGPALRKCMRANDAKLSAECKEHRAEVKEKIGDLKNACEADAEKLCPDVKGRARMKCLRENEAQVSAECKAEWDSLKAERKGRKGK